MPLSSYAVRPVSASASMLIPPSLPWNPLEMSGYVPLRSYAYPGRGQHRRPDRLHGIRNHAGYFRWRRRHGKPDRHSNVDKSLMKYRSGIPDNQILTGHFLPDFPGGGMSGIILQFQSFSGCKKKADPEFYLLVYETRNAPGSAGNAVSVL